jgi:hypothetical protein
MFLLCSESCASETPSTVVCKWWSIKVSFDSAESVSTLSKSVRCRFGESSLFFFRSVVGEFVIISYGRRTVLFFLTVFLVPVAVI